MNHIIFFDHSGIIRYLTPSLARMLNYETADLIGKSGALLIPQDDFRGLIATTAESRHFTSTSVDLKFREKDGAWRSVRGSWVTLVGLPDPAAVLTCLVAEDERQSANNKSDPSSPSLVADRLIAQLNHDIRNPLAAAQEALFLLKSVATDEGDVVQYLGWLEKALKNIMDTVINIHNPFSSNTPCPTVGESTCS